MPYMGKVDVKASDIKRFSVTGSTSATHVLSWTAPSEQALIITINGVKQQDGAYTIAGTPTTITLSSALVATDEMEVIGINDIGQTNTVAQDSIVTDMIRDDAVTSAKLDTNIAIDGDLTVDTDTLHVDSTNNRVGIGTSSPLANLHIVESSAFGTAQLGTIYYGQIKQAANNLEIIANGDQEYRVGLGTNNGTGHVVFKTAAYTTGNTERMRIDSSGNVLVGTTGTVTTGSEGVEIRGDYGYIKTARNNTGNVGHILFYNPNGNVGSINTNGSATAYNTSSDYRLKEDWQPMSGSIDRVKALNPVNFAWKVDGSRVDGFLAHEAQEVVSEAVTGTKDAVDAEGNPEYQGIDQSKLVPLLTAALQEAVAKIESLEARVAVLESN